VSSRPASISQSKISRARLARPSAWPGAFVRATLALGFVSSSVGCVSPQTSQALDRTLEKASQRADRPRHTQPPAADAGVDVELSGELDAETIVALAVARSPSLTVFAERARALVHGGRAEASLPAGELGFEAWNLPLAKPYALGDANMYMVELRQRFPPAGGRDGRARAQVAEAEAALAETENEERLVAERAVTIFARYQTAHRAQALAKQQLVLLGRMAEITRARYTTGGTALADGARVELEITKQRRTLARIEGEIAEERARLNALLRRPASAPLGPPRLGGPETIALSVQQLVEMAARHRGQSLASEARVRAAVARREAASAEASVPAFTVGGGYWQDPRMRPGLGLSAMMSLPWLWGPERHRKAEAEAQESVARAEHAGTGLEIETEIGEAHARLERVVGELGVIRREALPAALRARESVSANYVTGKTSLLEWVDAVRSTLELETEVVALEGDLALAVASLERAVGTKLPRTPVPATIRGGDDGQ
jgi:outer membrane protein, heavy metal efflux system